MEERKERYFLECCLGLNFFAYYYYWWLSTAKRCIETTLFTDICGGFDPSTSSGTVRLRLLNHRILEESHQIFYRLATADYLYASILADENFCRARTAIVG